MSEHNIVSVSGGKDSTALLLLAIERQPDNLRAVFADTGNEHELTYGYVGYLERVTGISIQWVEANFARQIAKKREFVATKWGEHGIAQEVIDRALEALVPTGNPFLDLCIWKGRFPSARAAFCSEELKRNPIYAQVHKPILDAGNDVVSWQGVRKDESLRRSLLSETEIKTVHDNGAELWNNRPLLNWTAEDCFAMHRRHGIKYNPLYKQGMGRVGCMPCIHSRKNELLEIGKRYPKVIDRIRRWEDAVKQASKYGQSTFFACDKMPGPHQKDTSLPMPGIDRVIEWSKTGNGGMQFDMWRSLDDLPACSSIYGLCE